VGVNPESLNIYNTFLLFAYRYLGFRSESIRKASGWNFPEAYGKLSPSMFRNKPSACHAGQGLWYTLSNEDSYT